MVETKEKLFTEFPPVSAQAWTDKIISDLKGASFEKKMVWKTGEGIDVNPFYTTEDVEEITEITSLPGAFPYIRGTKAGNMWLIRQDLEVVDCAVTNKKAKRLIAEGGVTALGFHLKSDSINAKNIALLLDGLCPEKTELNFKTCNRKVVDLIDILVDCFKTKKANLSVCKGSIAYDPFKKPLIKGVALNDAWVNEATAVMKAGEALPHYRVLAVNACYLNDAGSSLTQELGYTLAWGNELIAKLSEVGLPVDAVAKKIKFNFGITSNYFLEIAKFRAARWLWAEVVKAYQPVCDCRMKIHARTSEWNMTVYDTYVNLLRTQTEAMSAALAGVDSLTVLPYDYACQTQCESPVESSERIARNQQLLLKEECHFDKVADPAGGSYYIEVLTQSLADVAWQLFLEVEDKGGFSAVANKGEIQRAVNEINKSRHKNIATRRQILLGTNQYPNFTERAGKGVLTDSKCNCGCETGAIETLDFSRGASEFEALRLTTEKGGRAPIVFLLTIGNLAMRLARSQFSSNFFACAGYEIIDNPGFETVEEGVKAARKLQADIIVLCSSDDEYATFAPATYRLTEGKELFVVAGAPACMDDLKSLGIEFFIHLRSNVLETLQLFNQMLSMKTVEPQRN